MSPRVVAWVVAALMSAAPIASNAATAIVAIGSAEVRTAPHQVAPMIETLNIGQQVTVSEDATNGWRFVQLGDGRGGYVQDAHLQMVVPVTSPAPGAAPDAPPAPAVAASAIPPAAAPGAPARLAKPYVLRPDMNITYKGDIGDLFGGIVDASSLGLTVGGNMRERLAVEGTIGIYPGQSSGYTSGGTTMTYRIAAGMTVMAVARYAPLMTAGGRHALTVAGGAYSLVSGGFGPVAFAHGEAAYEFRGTYVTFLAGYGANLTLNDSERQTMVCGFGLFGPPPTCEVGFNQGDLLGHIRFGVGMTF